MLQCCLLPRKLSSVSQLPHFQRFIFRPSVALFHRSLWTFSSKKSGGIRENNTGGLCMLFTRREEIWVICFSLWPRIGSQKKGVHVYIYNCRWAKLSAWWSASRLGAPSSIQAYTTYMCYNYVYSNMYIYIYICSWHSFQSSIYIHEHFMKTNLNLNQSFPQQTSS